MKATRFSALILLSFTAGCGGSGGSSGTGTQEPPDGGTGSGGGTGSPGGGSTGASSVDIVFPWRKSAALASTVTVRGTASDPDGVAAVRVNGVDAAVTAASPGADAAKSAGGVLKSAPESRVRATSGSGLMTEHDSGEVEWSAEVELDPGSNDVAVTVEDDRGRSPRTPTRSRSSTPRCRARSAPTRATRGSWAGARR